MATNHTVNVSFTDMARDALDTAKRYKEKATVLKSNKADLQKACALINDIATTSAKGTTGRVSGWSCARTREWDDDCKIVLSIELLVEDCDSLTDMAFKRLVGRATMLGFEFNDEVRKVASQYDAGLRRTATFVVGMVRIDLTAQLRLKAGGATCRKVQIGTKVEEVPVFELQCN